MVERLQLDIAERKGVSGGGQVEHLLKSEGYLRVKKSRIVDKLFQEMADLTFFFKAVSSHPQLEELFEKDIEDLVGLRHYGPSFLKGDSKAILPTLLLHLLAKQDDKYRKSVIRVMLNQVLSKLDEELSKEFGSNISLKGEIARAKALGEFIKPKFTDNRKESRNGRGKHFEADRVFQNPWIRVKEPKDEEASIDIIGGNGRTIRSVKVT